MWPAPATKSAARDRTVLDERRAASDGPRMKARSVRLLAVVFLSFLGPLAQADVPPRDQAVCRGKRPGDLCAMADSGGGVCTIGACAGADPRDAGRCLACVKAPLNSPGAGFPVGLLVVAAVITLTATAIVIIKLRRHWGDKA
jgi:hypothetical protein